MIEILINFDKYKIRDSNVIVWNLKIKYLWFLNYARHKYLAYVIL